MFVQLLKKFGLGFAFLASFALAGCGGGGNSHGTPGLGGGSSSSGSTSATVAYQLSLSTAAGSGNSRIITATVKNSSGALVTGAVVQFSIGTNETGSSFTTASVQSALGLASVAYTPGSSAGTDTVIASVTPTATSSSTTVTPTYAAVALTSGGTTTTAPTMLVSSASGSTPVQAGLSTLITAQVTGGTNGQLVTFALGTNLSGASLRATPTSASASSVQVALSNGVATAYYIAGTYNGTDSINATLNTTSGAAVSASTTVTVTGGETLSNGGLSISATSPSGASPAAIAGGASAVVVATVLDATGSPVAGQAVTFSWGSYISQGSLGSGGGQNSATTVSATTGTDGTARVLYRAGTTAGADTINVSATASGASSPVVGSMTFDVTGGTANASNWTVAFTNPASNGPQLSLAPQSQAVLAARVLDSNNDPVPNAQVTFAFGSASTVAANGAPSLTDQASSQTVTTDSDGMVYTRYQAGPEAGTDTVLATVTSSGVILSSASTAITVSATGSSTYTLTLAAAPRPTSSTATCSEIANINGSSMVCGAMNPNMVDNYTQQQGIGNGVSITASVTDANGNPVGNANLVFLMGSTTTSAIVVYCYIPTAVPSSPNCTYAGSQGQIDSQLVQAGVMGVSSDVLPPPSQYSAITGTDGNAYAIYASGGQSGTDVVIVEVLDSTKTYVLSSQSITMTVN